MSNNGKPKRPPKSPEPIAEVSQQLPNGKWIRKGTKTPFRKADAVERDDRIQELAEFIMRHPFASRKKMSDRFCPRWGCSWKTIQWSYVEPARNRVRILASMTKDEAREKALGVVMRLMDHPNTKVRLRAVVAFSRITGIEAPTRTELSGPGGGPIQAQSVRPLADLSAEDLRKLAERALRG